MFGFASAYNLHSVRVFEYNIQPLPPPRGLEQLSDLFKRVHALRDPRQERKHMEQPVVLVTISRRPKV